MPGGVTKLFSNFAGLGTLPPASLLLTLPTFSTTTSTSLATSTSTTTSLPLPTMSPASGLIATPQSWPLPPKLVRRIISLEYVDMGELVPDGWQFQEEDQEKYCHQAKRPRRGPVTDILLWVECFSSMAAILATSYPPKISELMAYQKTIVRAHRSFSGEGWVTYDTCFRRKAAAMKSLDWGAVDFTLYNETFTGRAKSIPRCKFCMSEHHSSTECIFTAPDPPKKPIAPAPTYYTNRGGQQTF